MRTIDDIRVDIVAATTRNDATTLKELANEMRALGTPESEAVALLTLATTESLTGDYPAATELYLRALDLYQHLGSRSGLSNVECGLGILCMATGDNAKALEHFQRALDVHEEMGDRLAAARVNGNIGLVYTATGDYPSALVFHLRALAEWENTGDQANIARVTSSIATVYADTADYPRALDYFRKALSIQEQLSDRDGIARTTANLGSVYRMIADYAMALDCFQRAHVLLEELGYAHGVAAVTSNRGIVYANIGDNTAALNHLRRSLALHEDLGAHAGVANATVFISEVLMESEQYEEAAVLLDRLALMQIDSPIVLSGLAANRAKLAEHNNDLDLARDYLQQALAIVAEVGARASTAQYHQQLRDLARKRNDFEGYIHHNDEYNRITEEIHGKDATQKMAMMEAERKMEKERSEHQKQLAVLHSTLPKHIADRVARGETVNDHYDNASVIFLDIVGFTTLSDQLSSDQVVQLLEQIFTTVDAVCEKHDVVKIKTIGDSYMAVAFPSESSNSEQRAASAALDMLYAVSHILPDLPEGLRADLPEGVQVRIGLHCGPVTTGVIGTTRMQYDVWGDTVNTASRMESNGEAGRIHVSEPLAKALTAGSRLAVTLVHRGEIDVKGKGLLTTYWLEAQHHSSQ